MRNIILAILVAAGFTACKSKSTATTAPVNQDIAWLSEATLDQAKTESAKTGKPIFVDLSAVWCGYCKKMKKSVFTNQAVASAMNKGFVSLALDGEQGDGKALVAKLGISGFPTQLLLDSDGNVIKKNTGYLKSEELLAFLK